MRCIQLPNGRLLVPTDEDDPSALVEVGPDHPQYGTYLIHAEPGEDPRPRDRRQEGGPS